MRASRLVVFAAVVAASAPARAEPYRLRADAIGYSDTPQSPVGIVSLYGEDRLKPWVDAEALFWAGQAPDQRGPGDVLTVAVRVHDPSNIAELKLGRQIVTMGAIRPSHVDGALARVRAPSGTVLETFGGVPVARAFGAAPYDWIVGGRASQHLAGDTTFGASFFEARDQGRVANEEAGLDFATAPTKWFDVASRGAWDLVSPGLVEATASIAGRFGKLRPELYASHRSPSHLLPATSLFSALGDIPSDVLGATLEWRAAPRLDVLPSIAVRRADTEVGADASVRATLRLDDLGRGAVRFELRRQGAGSSPDRFTGARLATRVPIARKVTASTELELAFLDDTRRAGPGPLPWGLIALAWEPIAHLHLAGAIEAGATPQNVRALNALLSASSAWGGR